MTAEIIALKRGASARFCTAAAPRGPHANPHRHLYEDAIQALDALREKIPSGTPQHVALNQVARLLERETSSPGRPGW